MLRFFLAAAASVTWASSLADCQGGQCKVGVPEDEVSLMQTKVKQPSKPGSGNGQSGSGNSVFEDVEAGKRELREYAEELKESLDSGAAKSTGNTSLGACPRWANGGMGSITIGVSYLRSATVNNSIAKMLPGSDEPGPFSRWLGRIVRSRVGVDAASYDGINDQIIHDATPLITEGIGGAHIEVVPGATAKIKPGCGTPALCPNKKGMVLMEFDVCGSEPGPQLELFKCCNIWGSQTTTRLGGWARAVGDWALDKFANMERGKKLIGGQIIDGLTNELPGQLMAGLEEAKIGQPNIVVWPKKLEHNMFSELAAAPQAEVKPPKPDCPPTGPSGRC